MKNFLQSIAILLLSSLSFAQNGQVVDSPTNGATSYSQIVNLWASGNCIGTLNNDGTCTPTTTPANTAPGVTQLLSGGGVAWTSGLNFTVSPATYTIAGTQYTSVQTNLSLATANVTNPRIDVIAVDSTGAAVVITGTAAPSPAVPNVDPSTQLQLTQVLVAANATTPSTLTTTNLYLENTEWTCAVTANLVCASTNNPFAGTKDIEATSAVATNNVVLTKPSTTDQLSNYNNLVINIRSKATWAAAKSLAISWLNGSTVVGTSVGLKTGVFGFSSTNTASYQQIVIPVTAFNTGTANISALKIQVAGSGAAIGFYIDNVYLQGGVAASQVALPTMLLRQAWSSTATYNPNDVVTSNNASWAALVANTNSAPTSVNTNWTELGAVYTLPTQYTKLRCGTALGDGANAVAAATYPVYSCVNTSGVTWTITGLSCYTDNAGSTTMAVTNNAGTALLTGAVTCNNTKSAGGAAGTQSATVTLANNDALNFSFVSDGASKLITGTVSFTQ